MTSPNELSSLLALMQITDSALPIGGYSHSWGLETLVQMDRLTDAESAQHGITTALKHSIAPLEGRACALGWNAAAGGDTATFKTINDLLAAMRWASEVHQASISMGDRMRRLAISTGLVRSEQLPEGELHHAPTFGWLSQRLGTPRETAVAAYLQNAVASLISACVRLIPLGHTGGQRLLVELRPVISELAVNCAATDINSLASFAPLHEWACVEHESLYSRLFQS